MLGYRSHERWTFAAFAVSILYLVYVIDRSNFGLLILCFSLSFYAYYFWIDKKRFRNLKSIITHAIIVRVLLLFAVPRLSDDYFRFMWDGAVQLQGINPFALLPSALSDTSPALQEWLAGMNSPNYYSVYPPVMQGLFKGLAYIMGEDSLSQIIGMRLVLIASEIGIIYLAAAILMKMRLGVSNVAFYALNPLVIVEVVGNLHFEGLMIFFALLGIYILIKMQEKENIWLLPLAGVSLALAVMTKLVLLLALPAAWRWLGAGRTMLLGLCTLVVVALGFAPYVDAELIQNFGQSLDLYFRNFEFNASVFNLTNYIAGFYIPHYTVETVGPYITIAMAVILVLISLFRKGGSTERYFETLLLLLSVHLLFASTVHPWYIINLVAIAMFTQWRYPMVWSLLAILSYFMYSNDFIEVWWILAIEYVLVLAYYFYERRETRLE